MTTASTEKKGRGWFKEEFGNPERRTAYYMVLPSLLIIMIVAFFPVLYGVVLSLTDSTVTAFGSFVGLENYTEMFQDPDFRVGLFNTVVFTIASVTLEFVIGLAIALAVNRAFRGRGLVRAAILVPWAFPTVISAVMWRLMFQPGIGIFQYLAETIGLISRPVLSDQTLLLIAAILIDVWKTTPFMALLLLAGLQVIPGEVYEAARVDGASAWRAYRAVTLPLLRPALLVAAVLNLIYVFNSFPIVWTLNDRNPGFAHDTMITYMYKIAFKSALRDVGLAAALGVVNVVLILLAVVAYLRVSRWREEPV